MIIKVILVNWVTFTNKVKVSRVEAIGQYDNTGSVWGTILENVLKLTMLLDGPWALVCTTTVLWALMCKLLKPRERSSHRIKMHISIPTTKHGSSTNWQLHSCLPGLSPSFSDTLSSDFATNSAFLSLSLKSHQSLFSFSFPQSLLPTYSSYTVHTMWLSFC